MKKGFTLIELLIVVAIIAILAAIAIPNFLDAQVRSKVSRVKAELRSLANAIEAYQTDHNVPAPEAGNGPFPNITVLGQANQSGILTQAITTPVSYISKFDFIDPFVASNVGERPDVRIYTYKCYTWEWRIPPRSDSEPIYYNEDSVLNGYKFQELYGNWRLFSIGPDKKWGNRYDMPSVFSPASVGLPYDPTNGTISLGNIIRSQKFAEQKTWLPVNGQ